MTHGHCEDHSGEAISLIRWPRLPLAMTQLATIFTFVTFPLWAIPPQLPEPNPIIFSIPKPERFILSNGVTVYFLEDPELPQVQLTLRFRGGTTQEPADKIGLARLMAAVWPHGGTQELSPDNLTREMEMMASQISAGAEHESLSIGLFSLKKNFERSLEIFGGLVVRPKFDPGKLDIEKKKSVADIQRRNDNPADICSREFQRMVFGPESPWGRRTETATVRKVARRDVMEFHHAWVRPQGAVLAASGLISRPELEGLLEKYLGSGVWTPAAPPEPAFPDMPDLARKDRTVYIAAKDSALQSAIRIGHRGVKRHDPALIKIEVMDELLGGGFSSRMFRNIRSRLGLAYRVRSFFYAPAQPGLIGALIGTKPETTHRALEEIIKEIENLQKTPPEDAEINIIKGQMTNSFIQRFGTPFDTVSQIAELAFFGYPEDWLEHYVERVSQVTGKDVQSTALEFWKPGKAVILVVGNPAKFDHPLSSFGTVKSLDPISGEVKRDNSKMPSTGGNSL